MKRSPRLTCSFINLCEDCSNMKTKYEIENNQSLQTKDRSTIPLSQGSQTIDVLSRGQLSVQSIVYGLKMYSRDRPKQTILDT